MKTVDGNTDRSNLNSAAPVRPVQTLSLWLMLGAAASAETAIVSLKLGYAAGWSAPAAAAVLLALVFQWRREAELLFLLSVVLLFAAIRIRTVYPDSAQIQALTDIAPRGQPDNPQSCLAAVDARCLISDIPRRVRAGEVRFRCSGHIESRLDAGVVAGAVAVAAPDLPWLATSGAGPADRIMLEGRLEPAVCANGSLPKKTSYASYLLRRGLLGQIRIRRAGKIQLTSPEHARPPDFIERLDRTGAIPDDRRASIGVLLAAVLGKRDLLGEEAAEAFRRTGTTHLLVVSGFHVGVVYLLVRRLLLWLLARSRRLVTRFALEPAAAAGAIAAVAVYCALLNWDQTVVRSAIVVTIFGAASVLGRKSGSLQLLLLSLLIVIAVWPESYFEASLQLTAAACFALIFSARLLERLGISGRKGAKRYLIETAVTSAFAALFTAPVVLLWFGAIAPLAPLVNIAAIPLFGLGCIGLGASGFLLCYLGLPGGAVALNFAAMVTDWFVEFLWWFSDLVDGTLLGYVVLDQPQAEIAAIICSAAIGALVILFAFPKPKTSVVGPPPSSHLSPFRPPSVPLW